MSATITVKITQPAMDRLVHELKLKAPVDVAIRRAPNANCYGEYDPERRLITVFLGTHGRMHDRFSELAFKIVETILHEMRHVHQFENWDKERIAADMLKPYHWREIETDAREWARIATKDYLKTIEVRRQNKSPLSGLRAAEKGTR